jgi:glycosyltransferase involved in cell wall biosynthesis
MRYERDTFVAPPGRRETGNGDEPIRLLKFLAYLAIGGTERQILNLATGLDRRRFALHLSYFGRIEEQVATDLSHAAVQEYRIGKLYGVRAMRQAVRLASYLKRHRIDIVHAYNFYANVFAVPAARLAGVPVVLASVRDTGEYWTPRQRTVNRIVCRWADRVVVNAEAIKKGLIAEGYDHRRIVVIHNGIQCPATRPRPNTARLREQLGFPPDSPLVGVVARITPQKGLEYFLHAARDVAGRMPDARFVVVGGNWIDRVYRDGIERLAHRLGLEQVVRFMGFRLDVPDLLACLTLSVLPSISGEGLSNSLLESMAAGLPVVATTVGGNPEVVVDGETGLLVPPKDPTALAAAICRLLEDRALADSYGKAGRARVLARFGNERMVRKTEDLYHDLLQQSRQRRFTASRAN